jgi:hypothetical protein
VSRYFAETERKHEAILDHALRKDDLAHWQSPLLIGQASITGEIGKSAMVA